MSGKLNVLGNRKLKKAKRIEETHAEVVQPEKKTPTKRSSGGKRRKRLSAVKTPKNINLSIRVTEEEAERIKAYLQKNNQNFSDAAREALREKGML